MSLVGNDLSLLGNDIRLFGGSRFVGSSKGIRAISWWRIDSSRGLEGTSTYVSQRVVLCRYSDMS